MFLNPGFLLAMLAAAIPLVLHLSRRRKYRELEVGTLRFLQQAVRERRRKSRLEELPLLFLRMAAAGLLAFVFSRPFLLQAERRHEKGDRLIILLDESGSVTPDMTKAARAAAKAAVAGVGEGKVVLAAFSDGVRVLDELDRYEPRPGSPTKLDGALSWAIDQLSTEEGRAKVVLIAHLASHHLPVEPPRVWPPQLALEIVPLVAPSPDNAAVLDVALLTPFVQEEMELEARVILPATRRIEAERTVVLEAEGMRMSAALPAGTERLVFRFRPPREEIRGWISVEGNDAWPSDDRRPFVFRWKQRARVLLVDGDPGTTPFDGQAYFVDKALAASGAAHGLSNFQPEIVNALEGRSGLLDLSGVRAVAFCGTTELSPAAVRALGDFVAKGGGLLFVLNEKWSLGATMPLVQAGLFPEVVAFTGGEEKRSLLAWDRSHPALAMFDGREGGDLRELVWRDALQVSPGGEWKPLATLTSGTPVLLEKAAGDAGRVVVCAHPLTRHWSDLPRDPLFVPLVKNLFATLARTDLTSSEQPILHPGMQEPRGIGHHRDGDRTAVVAADASESWMAQANPAAARAAFGVPDPKLAAIRENAPAATESRSRPGELWPWLLCLLLGVLTVENIIATRKTSTAYTNP